MKKISIIERILLLCAVILTAAQIVSGIEGFKSPATLSFTIGFGTVLVVGLLLSIMGFEILSSPFTVIISTLIPLSISLGLILEFYPGFSTAYLVFAVIGFLAVIITRIIKTGKKGVIILAVIHGVAGITIFLVPIILTSQLIVNPGFLLVSLSGILMGIGGLLFSFLKTGFPLLSQVKTFKLLPVNLLIMTAAFTAGFKFV